VDTDGTCGATVADRITVPPSASEQDPELARDPEADSEISELELSPELELSQVVLEDPLCLEEDELPTSRLGVDILGPD
jgi:hypothetical protein